MYTNNQGSPVDRLILEALEREGWRVLWHPSSGTFEATKGTLRTCGVADSLGDVFDLLHEED